MDYILGFHANINIKLKNVQLFLRNLVLIVIFEWKFI